MKKIEENKIVPHNEYLLAVIETEELLKNNLTTEGKISTKK